MECAERWIMRGSPCGTKGRVNDVEFPTVGAVKPPTIVGTSG